MKPQRRFLFRWWAVALILVATASLLVLTAHLRQRDPSRGTWTPGREMAPPPRPRIPAKLPAGAQKMLDQNGFVVLGGAEAYELTGTYLGTYPCFISADAVLYVFHCLFRGGLTDYEKERLVPLTERLVATGLQAAERDWRRRREDPVLAEPARRNLIFFGVASTLLGQPPPGEVRAEVEDIVKKILAAREAGFYPDEDFTTYRPRGTYAEDAALARYFRTMRWLSRQILPVVPGHLDRPQEADIKLRQALLLGRWLSSHPSFRRTWKKLYDEIGFFIARPDSFTPLELIEVADRLHLTGYDEATLAALRQEFARDRYPASKIVSIPQGGPGDAPSKYVQFMGERFIPDGQIMQETCFPHVPGRTVPKGLDVAYALFDAPRAFTHLGPEMQKFPGLREQLLRLKQDFSDYGEGGKEPSIYAGWAVALRAASVPARSPHLPQALSTPAWQDKCLNTVLAAWTQMRHDFLLYAKQPMVPACGGMGAFVEPVPETYRVLAELSDRLAKRGMVGFAELALLCRNLEKIAKAEIAGEDWRDKLEGLSDFYIYSFGQWLLQKFSEHVARERPCVVVDVAADSNPPHPVLHEATGPFNYIVIEYESKDTPEKLYRGWVFSYYEFTRDEFERLTDEQWEDLVRCGKHRPYRPSWTRSFVYGG